MKTNPTHSALPWHWLGGPIILDKNMREVLSTSVRGKTPAENEANAKYVFQAIKDRDELLDAMKQFVEDGADWSPDGLDMFADHFRMLMEGK